MTGCEFCNKPAAPFCDCFACDKCDKLVSPDDECSFCMMCPTCCTCEPFTAADAKAYAQLADAMRAEGDDA